MKTAMILVWAIMVVFLADFSQAEIVSRKYDANSNKTLIEYRLVKGDNPWKIYANNYPGRVTDKTVKTEIMKPNGIVDPRKIRVGTVIKFQIKGAVTKSDARDVSAVEILKPEIGGQSSSVGNISSNSTFVSQGPRIPLRPTLEGDVDFKSAKAGGKEREGENNTSVKVQELEEQLKADMIKIERLESEINTLENSIREKDSQILFLEETINSKFRKKESEVTDLKKKEAGKNLAFNALILERAKNNRIKWVIITVFCLFILLVYIGYNFMKECNPKIKRRKVRIQFF